MRTKICGACSEDLPIEQFSNYTNKNKGDGKQSKCKDCQKAYKDKHYQDNRQKYLDNRRAYKAKTIKILKDNVRKIKSAGCTTCPEKDVICIDFHHIDPTKKDYNISEMVGICMSWKLIKKEINKCILICSNCHRKLHRDKKDSKRL